MKRRWITVLALITIFLTFASVGCNKPEAVAQTRQPQTPTASEGDVSNVAAGYVAQWYTTTKMDDLKQHVPFSLNVPSYLPNGYTFISGMVISNPPVTSIRTEVDMTFAAEGKPSILLIESEDELTYASMPNGTVERTNVRLGSVTGEMWKHSNGTVIFLFKAKSLYHIINAEGVLEAELLKVAQSLSQ